MESTVCTQMTNAKEQASLLPNLPGEACMCQARVLKGFQVSKVEVEQKEKRNQRKWNL